MRIPIAEDDLGYWHYVLGSGDYCRFCPCYGNWIDFYNEKKGYRLTTFAQFKERFPIQVAGPTYRCKKK